MLASKRGEEEDAHDDEGLICSPHKPTLDQSMSAYKTEALYDLADIDVDSETEEFKMPDISGTLIDSSRNDPGPYIHINSIRLTLNRSPGSYLSD